LAKIVVEKRELEGIRDNICSILKTGSNFTIPVLEPIYENYDLNEKEDLIIKYLNKNPRHSKEQVVSGCSGKYSRVTILKSIEGLLKRGFIIKENNSNKRTYHLFVNNQDVAISFEESLKAFNGFYCLLLDEIAPVLKKLSNDEMKKSKLDNLIKAIIEPYKYLCIMYIMSDLLLWDVRPLDDNALHTKFAVFVNFMRQIQIKLNWLFANVKSNPIAIQLLSDSSYGFNERNILHILKTFEEYDLSGYAEAVVDSLWKMSYPILPSIYPSRYQKQFEDGTLKDWRKLFEDNPKLGYKPKDEMLPFEK
jgi:DNA-binding MarR family transcriptional regulator